MANRNEIQVIIKGFDQASGPIGKVGKSLGSLGKIAAIGIGAIVAGSAAAVGALTALAIAAAPMEGIENAFEGITASAGIMGSEMVASLKDASAGMISTRDLMTSFNKASQLVSVQFGEQLPDAMTSLRKVASATGEDMDFLLNSLVTGIGRLSPMILDNLGIQVDLNAAFSDYADELGIAQGELSKTQQQTALMNQVMGKLEANTAAMPDVLGTASQKLGEMMARAQDLKDSLGVALLPALSDVGNALLKLADKILPPLVSFFENKLAPTVAEIAKSFDLFFAFLRIGKDPVEALNRSIKGLFPKETVDKIMQVVRGFQGIIDLVTRGDITGGFLEMFGLFEDSPIVATLLDIRTAIAGIIEPIAAWLSENIKLQDILIALGLVIAAVIIPALFAILQPILIIIAVFAALAVGIALLRGAWESDFLGMRTALGQFWEGVAKPVFEALKTFFTQTLPPAIATLSGFLTGTLIPAFMAVWGFLSETFFPIMAALNELLGTILVAAVSILIAIFLNVLLPAMQAIHSFIGKALQPILETLSGLIGDKLKKAAGDTTGFLDAFRKSLEFIKDIVGKVVTLIQNLVTAIGNLPNVLPSWATLGSPPPFADALNQIAAAAMNAAGPLRSFDRSLGLRTPFAGAGATAGGTMGGSGGGIIRLVVPLILDGREVGRGSIEGTLDELNKRGILTAEIE